MNRIFALTLGISLFAAALAPQAALAGKTRLLGGPGGSEDVIPCDNGTFLVGLDAMMGLWTDRVRPVCKAWDPRRTSLNGPELRGRWVGTSGGGSLVFGRCAHKEFVKRVTAGATRDDNNNPAFVQNIGIGCSSYLTPDALDDSDSLNGGAGSNFAWGDNCPLGEVATGIRVRAGVYVDAIGLVCGPPPSGSLFPRVPRPSDATRVPDVTDHRTPGEVPTRAGSDNTPSDEDIRRLRNHRFGHGH